MSEKKIDPKEYDPPPKEVRDDFGSFAERRDWQQEVRIKPDAPPPKKD